MRAFYYVAISTAAALLSACTVGPNYYRPVVQISDHAEPA